MYNYVETTGIIPGTYIQPNRPMHSKSVSASSFTEITKLLRSPPSVPVLKEEIYDAEQSTGLSTKCSEGNGGEFNPTGAACSDPALRFLSELEEVPNLEEVSLTPEEEEALLIETTYGALFSHLWWTLWALIQSQISSIDFGFIVSATLLLKRESIRSQTLK